MNLQQLQRTVQSGQIAPVYLIHGPEWFFRAEALGVIRKAAMNLDSDVTELDGREIEAAALMDQLRTPTLFAPRRLLILTDAERFLTEAQKLLRDYVGSPASNATLVLVAAAVDRRRKGIKELLQGVCSVECPPLNPRELAAWCVQRARLYGKGMDPAAAQLLVDLAGRNLGHLDAQIQAVAAYCRTRKKVTRKDVSDLVGEDHTQTVWDLTSAITDGSHKKALRTLNRLFREPKTSPPWIIAAMTRNARELWQVKFLLTRGASQTEIETRLGKKTWIIRKLCAAVAKTDLKRLRDNQQLLLRADMETKSSTAPKEWILEELVMRLCGNTKRK